MDIQRILIRPLPKQYVIYIFDYLREKCGTRFSWFSSSLEEMQSSSVTSNGWLWLQALARIAYENPLTVSQCEIEEKELPQSIVPSQRDAALIQLLRSWREGDEQEQRSTWECLKRALDEDRLSERKLFP